MKEIEHILSTGKEVSEEARREYQGLTRWRKGEFFWEGDLQEDQSMEVQIGVLSSDNVMKKARQIMQESYGYKESDVLKEMGEYMRLAKETKFHQTDEYS